MDNDSQVLIESESKTSEKRRVTVSSNRSKLPSNRVIPAQVNSGGGICGGTYVGPRQKSEADTKQQEELVEETTAKQEKYESIPIELIEIEDNIRHTYNEDRIKEMAASLKTEGQLQPIRVYKKADDKYVIITGHRRYKAAQEAKISHLTCIVCEKPATDVDRLYTQAIENEQRENISPADRENYITALIKAGQTSENICKKMGKSPAWLSQAIKAKEGRDKFGAKFTEANIELDTYSAYQIAGATEQAVDTAIQAIKANSKQKKAILKAVAQSKKQTTTKGRPRKTEQPEPPATKAESLFGYTITINDEDKSVTIGLNQSSNELIQGLYTQHGEDVKDRINKYFQDKGYTVT